MSAVLGAAQFWKSTTHTHTHTKPGVGEQVVSGIFHRASRLWRKVKLCNTIHSFKKHACMPVHCTETAALIYIEHWS